MSSNNNNENKEEESLSDLFQQQFSCLEGRRIPRSCELVVDFPVTSTAAAEAATATAASFFSGNVFIVDKQSICQVKLAIGFLLGSSIIFKNVHNFFSGSKILRLLPNCQCKNDVRQASNHLLVWRRCPKFFPFSPCETRGWGFCFMCCLCFSLSLTFSSSLHSSSTLVLLTFVSLVDQWMNKQWMNVDVFHSLFLSMCCPLLILIFVFFYLFIYLSMNILQLIF